MMTFVYIVLALLGISFLVFIHELGHYFVAKRQKMKVEVFSIGMGKPLISWMRKGVKWQICPLLFGGYVKIAGMEPSEKREKDNSTFYGSGPLARVKVLLAGPVVNLAFALVAFTAIWLLGGRSEQFSKHTKIIGAMDPASELYQKGVLPGDELRKYNDRVYGGYQDLLTQSVIHEEQASVELYKVGYFTGEKKLVDYTVKPYEMSALSKGFQTVGILTPASYLIFAGHSSESENSPLVGSGIELADRIVWVDGELIFSQAMLQEALNDSSAFVAIEREGKTLLGRVPRLEVQDIKMPPEELAEIEDWHFSRKGNVLIQSVKVLPYLISDEMVVEKELPFIDRDSHFTKPSLYRAAREVDLTLKPGDKILMVDGEKVDSLASLRNRLESKHVQVIVERSSSLLNPVSWEKEDEAFLHRTNWKQLLPMLSSVADEDPVTKSGSFVKLASIKPVKFKDFPLSPEQKASYEKALIERKKEIEAMPDEGAKIAALKELNKQENRLVIGAQFKDKQVIYNPGPFTLFSNVTEEIVTTLKALFSGKTNPKHMGGPLLVVSVIQKSMSVSSKEALYWLGAISLNLGLLNLLPIPVLDGGHITIAAIEGVRKKPLKASTIKMLMLPFAILLIGFFVFITYQDIFRLMGF